MIHKIHKSKFIALCHCFLIALQRCFFAFIGILSPVLASLPGHFHCIFNKYFHLKTYKNLGNFIKIYVFARTYIFIHKHT